MFIDTHCHLQKKFYVDIDRLLKENREAGIYRIIVSGCNKEEIEEILTYAKKYDEIYLTIGFHPEECENVKETDIIWLKDIILNNPKVIGIGEIGLDYHYSSVKKKSQKKIFELQLSLAQELDLPVVIHTRDAILDTINILKKYHLQGDIHCFSGTIDDAKTLINMGYFLGIGGVVTFKNSNLRNDLKDIGLDNILLETDSPYLSPEPFRGKLNSSKNIPLIAMEISKSLGISVEKVSEITTNNALKLFRLK